MKAWVYQDDKQVKKHGADKASWYVGWIDPEGKRLCKSCGPGSEGQRNAEKLRKKREAELITGTYQSNAKATWEGFREGYDRKILDGMGNGSRLSRTAALGHFERLCRPKLMRGISTATLADFVAKRRTEEGLKPGDIVSPATINRELRELRAVIRKAFKWGHLAKLPEFEFLREPKKLPTYVNPEHFAAIYQACDVAELPGKLPYPAATWWRGLLMTAYLTGWRIGSLLALRRDDVNLDEATAISRAEDNKGKRDQFVSLNPVVVEHLRKLPSFEPVFFPWNINRRVLWDEFARIQQAAGVGSHYGFHDLRRAFATMNADRLTTDVLQAMMQHRDYTTTQRYIAMARQLKPAAQHVYVPDVTSKPTRRVIEG